MKFNAFSSKCCSLLLVFILLLTPIAPVVATVEGQVALVPALMTGNTVSLAMQIDSEWEGYFNGTLTLTNTGEKPIENWALSFAFPHTITNIWNGVIYEQADGMYTVKNAGWNQDIPVGGSVNFGFTAQQNGEALTPDFYFINIAERSVPSSDYVASYKLKKDWGTGFSGEITIANSSSQAIEDWSFSMDFARTITTASNTIFTQGEGTQYLLNNPGYDQNISSGKSIKIGIQGTGGVETDVPSNFNVSQITVGVSLTGDYDADGVKDYEELVIYGTDPLLDDSNTDPEDPDLVTDTDGDGIPDYYETEFGTDPNLADTDGDGLSDYEDIFLGYNPLLADSDSNGISDVDEDPDDDGLSTRIELQVGTIPVQPDTDEDGLSDGEEVNKYYTDPLLADSDGDEISDSDELSISLDPMNASTNGIPDNEYTVEYSFASDSPMLEKINTPENTYALSIEINAAGNVLGNLTAAKSPYSKTMENEAIIGIIPELSYDDNMSIESFTIQFKIQDSLIANPDSTYATVNPEFSGIKRYNIFYYDENVDILFPVDTQYDLENQTVYADTTMLGTYCIMDVEAWLEGMGIMPEDIAIDTAVSGISDLSSDELSVSFLNTATPADTAEGKITFLTTNTNLSNSGSVSLMSAEDVVAEGSYEGHNYAIVDKGLTWDEAEAYCEYMAGHLVTITSEGEQDYINSLLVSGAKNSYWIGAKMNVDGSYTKWITGESMMNYTHFYTYQPDHAGNQEDVLMMYKNNNGAWPLCFGFWNDLNRNGTCYGQTFFGIENFGLICEWETKVKIVYGTSLKMCNIASTISNISDQDADWDGIPNWQEVNSNLDMGFFNIDGTYIPESYANFIAKYHPSMFFTRYNINPLFISVIPTKSNPEKKDGDGDGLWDGAAQYVGSEMIAPEDQEDQKANGPDGIWQEHIFQKKYGKNPTSYSENSGFNPNISDEFAQAIVELGLSKRDDILKNEETLKTALSFAKSYFEGNTEAGAYFLNFILDENNKAYHSQVDTWQREFGYNDLYDDFFRIGSKMAEDKFYFTGNQKSYVLWVWKGDYWNLQSGAEMGLYVYDKTIANTPHYNSVDFELPMTLSLYNYYSKDAINNVFNWAPDDDQWWITGFNPSFPDPNPNDMVIIGTIDFSGRKNMYDLLKTKTEKDKELRDYIIFDDDELTAWIIWDKGVTAS